MPACPSGGGATYTTSILTEMQDPSQEGVRPGVNNHPAGGRTESSREPIVDATTGTTAARARCKKKADPTNYQCYG